MGDFDPYAISGRKNPEDTPRDERPGKLMDGRTESSNMLRAFVERIERLEEEKASVADDIKAVYGELKAMGFDPKATRATIRIRKLGIDEWNEATAVLDSYLAALNMIARGEE